MLVDEPDHLVVGRSSSAAKSRGRFEDLVGTASFSQLAAQAPVLLLE
nr:hypothetical protein [Dermabacter sp. HMSC08H10]